MKNLASNIEAIRKSRHVKQEVIAQALGIKQPAYSSYVTRNEDFKFSFLLKISDILEVSVIDIITYPEKYVPESSVAKSCPDCAEKDLTIKHLNEYIATLSKSNK